jgi:hypothetical protein
MRISYRLDIPASPFNFFNTLIFQSFLLFNLDYAITMPSPNGASKPVFEPYGPNLKVSYLIFGRIFSIK